MALWLQANPQLSHDDVMTIIRETSVKDSHVSSSATPMQWGEGKLDALAGTKLALKMATSGLDETTVDGSRHFVVTETGNRCYNIFHSGNKHIHIPIEKTNPPIVPKIISNKVSFFII